MEQKDKTNAYDYMKAQGFINVPELSIDMYEADKNKPLEDREKRYKFHITSNYKEDNLVFLNLKYADEFLAEDGYHCEVRDVTNVHFSKKAFKYRIEWYLKYQY